MTLTVEIDDTDDGRVLIEQSLQLTLQGIGTPLTPVEPADVRMVLRWVSNDPLVVEPRFVLDEAARLGWIWGRDLLFAGLSGPAAGIGGVGDLSVRPSGRGMVEIELSSLDGHALFTVPSGDLQAFLHRTYDVVR